MPQADVARMAAQAAKDCGGIKDDVVKAVALATAKAASNAVKAQVGKGGPIDAKAEAAAIKAAMAPKKAGPAQEPPVPIEELLSIAQNSLYHTVRACSGEAGKVYSAASEVGVVCKLTYNEKSGEGEAVFVIPSLETRDLQGEFDLTILCTNEVEVERVI